MTPAPLPGVSDLLDALSRAGVALALAAGGRLRWSAPTGAMTPELIAALRRQKGELIARLVASAQKCPDPDPMPPPAEPVAGADAERDAVEERAAILEYDAGLPRAWAEGAARLRTGQRADSADSRLPAGQGDLSELSAQTARLPAPMRLPSGRLFWKLPTDRGAATEEAAALVQQARASDIWLSVDGGPQLGICVPVGYRGSLHEQIAAHAGDVVAVWCAQAHERMRNARVSAP